MVVNNSKAASAESSRPAAFKRGPSTKPMCVAVVRGRLSSATFARAKSPCRWVVRMIWRPLRTRTRFSPVSGARSATVPRATRSSNESSVSVSCVSVSRNTERDAISREPGIRCSLASIKAWAILYATPTPAKSLSGYVSPGCLGLITANAGGSSPAAGWWWSEMMRSRPMVRAYAASSGERMPQSTVMTSLTPCSLRLSNASGFNP